MSIEQSFDPSAYLSRVNGSEYLEVKWRLLWLRRVDPSARITTELSSHHDQMAIFKASVELSTGGSATGWGTETSNDFRDYVEKAETKALGRSLAALGFGTQFTTDFEFGVPPGRVVDAPVTANRQPDSKMTERQYGLLKSLLRDRQIDDEALNAMLVERYDVNGLNQLLKNDASNLIDHLQASTTKEQAA